MSEFWTISRLVEAVKDVLRDDYVLQNVLVCGEIGRFTAHPSGHWYFSLKDENAAIDAVMFATSNRQVGFMPKTGDQVVISGRIDVFAPSGHLQLMASTLKMAGKGDLHAEFEKIYQRLKAAGYFAVEHKKAIPPYAQRIGVITGQTTAALQDIRVTINNRWPAAELVECYALVQGSTAAASIITAFAKAVSRRCDVIILARGGGSMEDLWCFNDEKLAKTIYDCPVPVITGIGHEIDFTIAEMVADCRCATPTAAATKAVADQKEVRQAIRSYQTSLVAAIKNIADVQRQKLDYSLSRLAAFTGAGQNQRLKWVKLNQALLLDMTLKISRQHDSTAQLRKELLGSIVQYSDKKNEKFGQLKKLLSSVSPLNIISRGYAITTQKGQVIKKAIDVDMDSPVDIRYADGMLTVKPVERKQ